MCLFLRMTVAVMLMFAAIMREGASKEVLFDIEDAGADSEGVESEEVKGRPIAFSPLPLCALQTTELRFEDDDDDENMEYLPSTYREVRCSKNGEVGHSEQNCASPFVKRNYPPAGLWGSTTCLQRWDTVTTFRRPAGSNEMWQMYKKKIASGCECVIMTPEPEEEGGNGPMVDHQGGRMVPVALQRYANSNRYGRSIQIEV
ncbi:hypothetical protein J437_LFUL016076 [Ladona fulva]|uniref:Uncharacterized protein n=1 Tax=Ladona fulva TaxID=123851 RepID=A0A8K0KHY8_LADFU|nr:hypothetical protein J437_LFUL016076 [Ladona fulva]